MSAELKPCPWCGVQLKDARVLEGETFRWRRVQGCCTDGPEVRVNTLSDDREEAEREARAQAYAAWNTRAPQWLPIESAPRDGSWVVLGRAGHGAVLLAFWHRLHGAWWGQGGDDGQWKKWKQATHWQPLPTPPEVQP